MPFRNSTNIVIVVVALSLQISSANSSSESFSRNMSFSSTPPPTKKLKSEESSSNSNQAPFLSPPQGAHSLNTVNESNSTSQVGHGSDSSNEQKESVKSLMLREAGYDIDAPSNTKKRQNYLDWDDYFMGVSFLSAQRSKDPEIQLGACIVDEDNRIVGIGYNGFPRGCSDECLPWASIDEKGRDLHTKHPFLCPAEVNAILNKCSADVKGTRMYVAGIPDNVAAKTIIQAGISEIVYLNEPGDDDSTRASRIMFEMSGVKLRRYEANAISPLDFSKIEGKQCKATSSGLEPTLTSQNDTIKHRDLLMKEASFDPKKAKVRKREEYLSWDDYFTAVAFLSARRSKDPNTQVGCCIVDSNKCIVGIGYNGFPRGCSDEHLPWARVADSELHKKYPYVVHAEVNAILNKGSKDVKGASLFVALFPCCECAKVIIQAGIKEIVYLSDVVSSGTHSHFSLKVSLIFLLTFSFSVEYSTMKQTHAGQVGLCSKWLD